MPVRGFVSSYRNHHKHSNTEGEYFKEIQINNGMKVTLQTEFLSFWMPRFFIKYFFFLSANCFPSAHAVLRPHAREQPMELWRGLFHNTSCWEMADPLFSRPTSLWARVPAVSTLKKHTSLPGYIFLAFLHRPEATVTIPALSLPLLQALHFSLHSLH